MMLAVCHDDAIFNGVVIVQCNVYCCRHQSEVTRLRSANSGLQDELDSVRQKLQEGESVRAKVGQRLLVLLLVIVHCSFHYDDKFGHHILWLVLKADCLCRCGSCSPPYPLFL